MMPIEEFKQGLEFCRSNKTIKVLLKMMQLPPHYFKGKLVLLKF